MFGGMQPSLPPLAHSLRVQMRRTSHEHIHAESAIEALEGDTGVTGCAGDKASGVEGTMPGAETAPVLQLAEGGPIATGEEDENTVFFSESVLFNFDAGWKERGRGELRVLVAPSGL